MNFSMPLKLVDMSEAMIQSPHCGMEKAMRLNRSFADSSLSGAKHLDLDNVQAYGVFVVCGVKDLGCDRVFDSALASMLG